MQEETFQVILIVLGVLFFLSYSIGMYFFKKYFDIFFEQKRALAMQELINNNIVSSAIISNILSSPKLTIDLSNNIQPTHGQSISAKESEISIATANTPSSFQERVIPIWLSIVIEVILISFLFGVILSFFQDHNVNAVEDYLFLFVIVAFILSLMLLFYYLSRKITVKRDIVIKEAVDAEKEDKPEGHIKITPSIK